jgi:hypothetical protein
MSSRAQGEFRPEKRSPRRQPKKSAPVLVTVPPPACPLLAVIRPRQGKNPGLINGLGFNDLMGLGANALGPFTKLPARPFPFSSQWPIFNIPKIPSRLVRLSARCLRLLGHHFSKVPASIITAAARDTFSLHFSTRSCSGLCT